MHVLVTGGAGYVGSNVVRALRDAGHAVSVLDDLSSGHRDSLPGDVVLVVSRCGDHKALSELAAEHPIDGVMHMAARCSVAESMQDPASYYQAILRDSLDLLDWIVAAGVRWIIHSSTCAVYGVPTRQPIDETCCPRPISAYGASKLAVDDAIRFYTKAYSLHGTSLRYFNAAGAHPDGSLGEDKTPASNLIPRVLAVALGDQPAVEVFGNQHPGSADGTGVRDYVHVSDLAAAHLAAMRVLVAGNEGTIYNLGTEVGSTVLEVVDAARAATGHSIPARLCAPRPGDPPVLVASSERARNELGWLPARSGLDQIIADAWRWHRLHPQGYRPPAEP